MSAKEPPKEIKILTGIHGKVIPCERYARTHSQLNYLGQEVRILSSGNGSHICECKDKQIVTFSSDELNTEQDVYTLLTPEELGPVFSIRELTPGLRGYIPYPIVSKINVNNIIPSRMFHARILATSNSYDDQIFCHWTILDGKKIGNDVEFPIKGERTAFQFYKENRTKGLNLIEFAGRSPGYGYVYKKEVQGSKTDS